MTADPPGPGEPTAAPVLPATRPTGRRLVARAAVPAYLEPLVSRLDGSPLPLRVLHATGSAPDGARRSAVLILLAEGREHRPGVDPGEFRPDVLLTARATTLRSHAGQPAFPGGGFEPGEDAVAAAIREGREETGLDPSSVMPLAVLPQMYLRPSGFVVDPVVAHWRHPGPVRVMDPAETSAVVRVPIVDLADPSNRGVVRFRDFTSPAFTVAGLVVWGFTAGLLDLLLDWSGWSQPWDRGREIALDTEAVRLAEQARPRVTS